MWKKTENEKPSFFGQFMCFGTVCVGTEYEQKSKFYACYNNGVFTDKDGEDLIGINESVEYWFDFSNVEDPK